jgi:hypothetical protein
VRDLDRSSGDEFEAAAGLANSAIYEATRTDSCWFRNTEIFGFDGDRISRVEVHVGWDIS